MYKKAFNILICFLILKTTKVDNIDNLINLVSYRMSR